jgi:hypothetical protein
MCNISVCFKGYHYNYVKFFQQNKTHIPIEWYNVREEGNTQTKNEEQCIRKLTSVFIPKCDVCFIWCALGRSAMYNISF